MSGLAYICGYGYGSNSDESDCEYVPIDRKRQKLPTPDLSKVSIVPQDEHVDDPELHGGRSRSFPHVRGNWATFIYIKYLEGELQNLVDKLQTATSFIDNSCQKCKDIHVSLSRTVVLTYHLITPFSISIQTALKNVESFELGFDSVKVYCNEEKTRTFIALKADCASNQYLQKITKIVDEVLLEYKLEPFYEDPSFHMSILWVNGNKQKELTTIIQDLNHIVAEEIGRSLKSVLVNKLHCKSGNKHFQYFLE
ncbi:U6 snRNA phosphodiesterase 1 [Pectinophora gossypiella]|uniref:U6 snRNA phosphodiesterase 1 n=1 Tax=Pectinophora gossypiella TaxID=13191 RepID=UPI00214EB630|nr:U6 snRNA phosphodiesterase 1 [Pectinophora gossypiella]